MKAGFHTFRDKFNISILDMQSLHSLNKFAIASDLID